jgi:light-regulated signal transduction histidine kinase (bacteriophytochrome)
VLEYARLSTDLALESIDSNKMLAEVIENLAFQINETNATINIKQLPSISGYKKILSLVFQNIINNALKFTKPNTNAIVDISCQQANDHWLFQIKDNGIGIRTEYQEKIFNLFQRVHREDEYKGSGIGLSHCKKVVELHNGEIWVDSKAGFGSEFCFTIPMKNE